MKAFPRKSCNDPKDLVTAGLSGKALRVGNLPGKNGHDTVAYYAKNGIVSEKQGSFSFWMKAVDWDQDNRKNHVFLRLLNSDSTSLVAVAQNRRGKFCINLLSGVLKSGSRSVEVTGIQKDWRKGEWHHVAATWTADRISLYLDGEFIASRNIVPLKKPYTNLSFRDRFRTFRRLL